MKKSTFVESEFTSEHFEAIGKIVVYFQKVEESINLTLITFLGINFLEKKAKTAHALLSESSFKTKISVILSIINEIKSFDDVSELFLFENASMNDELLTEIETLKQVLKKAEKCAPIRNKYIHSHWIDGGIGVPEGAVFRQKSTAKGSRTKHETEYVTVDVLDKHVEFIKSTSDDLIKISVLLMSLSQGSHKRRQRA
ncbi:hypothetical protein NQT74_14640 [Alteromonas stellipolaris]|uniref:hypothetical protein n=1 Tax=Alteromonas stellipolaris TaxID=233316 RepID=UPI0021179EF3|nr:hypothetical protein [Alteromonas stellipolaris]MCQ8849821.1 hypothetical protein [Alteromonas stellipolaris]